MSPIRAVKGMNDVLPADVGRWQRVERAYARTMNLYGYREVRTPLIEPTSLFVRAMGETTDVVEKEMYSFAHHGEELTLRPEGTAGAVRAYVEHSVHGREPLARWWYSGPMFRAERPQRGRYRQFTQLGAEIFGDEGPGADAEMIDMLVGFLTELGVRDVQVLVNSLGGPATRTRYREALVAHLTPNASGLSNESQRRLQTNPLRILDSKDERDRSAVADAPTLQQFLDASDLSHFQKLRELLDALGTPYSVDARLVRGLDYYTRTLFEIKGAEDRLGAGSTLVGGGRYDGMVADLGGPSVPAIGFAAGLERLLIASDGEPDSALADVLIAPLGSAALGPGVVLARDLRRLGVRCEIDTRGSSLKSQLRRANAIGARLAFILGDSELESGSVQLKDLSAHTQKLVARDEALRIASAIASTASSSRPAPSTPRAPEDA